MSKAIQFFLSLAVLFQFHSGLKAQATSNLVSRKIEKIFDYDRNGEIIIDAERGNINIQSWDRNEISIVLTITFKNANLSLAKKELEFMHYNLVKSRSNIFLNNKMVLPDLEKNREISSIIIAKYEIQVPEKADISINNKYGRVTIGKIDAKLHGDLQYSDIFLQSYNGDINMNISVGDLNCFQSVLTGDIRTRHANVTFQEVSGKMSLHTEYGSFKLTCGEKLFELKINSYATDMLIDNRPCHPVDLLINGAYCPLTISKDCYTPEKKFLQSTYQQDIEQASWLLQYIPPVKSAKLRIEAKFGTLSLL